MSIQILDHGRLREIRLARPPVNALDSALCQALSVAVQQAGEEVDGIVLSGSERIFSGGMDVPHLLAHGTDRAALLASWTAFFEAAQALANSRVPVV
ncbi:enoyl-CoA hydratase/isomerase family protein, partial [Xanthomonas oryzae pv. oryzae]